MAHLRRLGLVLAAAVISTSGCALGPDEDGAVDTAAAFTDDLAAGDSAAACTLLAPATLTELEESTGLPCPDAVEDADLPVGRGLVDVSAYVRTARVRLDGDVVFVSEFADRWRVIAAGCTLQPDDSYDCVLKGG